ncbi:hypothetical protein KQI84_16765 [bacterium]|nr:hypothetical protein [bacterium]
MSEFENETNQFASDTFPDVEPIRFFRLLWQARKASLASVLSKKFARWIAPVLILALLWSAVIVFSNWQIDKTIALPENEAGPSIILGFALLAIHLACAAAYTLLPVFFAVGIHRAMKRGAITLIGEDPSCTFFATLIPYVVLLVEVKIAFVPSVPFLAHMVPAGPLNTESIGLISIRSIAEVLNLALGVPLELLSGSAIILRFLVSDKVTGIKNNRPATGVILPYLAIGAAVAFAASLPLALPSTNELTVVTFSDEFVALISIALQTLAAFLVARFFWRTDFPLFEKAYSTNRGET